MLCVTVLWHAASGGAATLWSVASAAELLRLGGIEARLLQRCPAACRPRSCGARAQHYAMHHGRGGGGAGDVMAAGRRVWALVPD